LRSGARDRDRRPAAGRATTAGPLASRSCYSGFNALFGHKFVAPVIAPGGLNDLDGNPITGFPGFGEISASQTLAYVAAMQEHGVPVTFAYISDVHDNHAGEGTFGPGEAGYVAQLKAYDHAWDLFFQRLAAGGITKENTLFVITADEGDHFAGGPPAPAGCDGVTVPCTYAKIGEIDANITTLIDNVDPSLASTQFDIHFDMAPTFDIIGNPTVGSPLARKFERAASKLTAVSPITGNTDVLTRYLADPVELKLLHMITGDPQRTPNFVMFGNPDYYFQTFGTLQEEGPGGVRVEPRRRGAGDQHDLARSRRPRCPQRGRRGPRLVGSHRHPSDDPRALRADRRLHFGRPRALRGAAQARDRSPATTRTWRSPRASTRRSRRRWVRSASLH
jgi:hypothetical protein